MPTMKSYIPSSSESTLVASSASDHRKMLGLLDHDNGTCSESEDVETPTEEVEDDVNDDDDNQTFIGISIGREQDRLRAPQTPAADKAAAIGDQDPLDAALGQQETFSNDNTITHQRRAQTSNAPETIANSGRHTSTEQSVTFQDTDDTFNTTFNRPQISSANAQSNTTSKPSMSSVMLAERQRPRSHSGPSSGNSSHSRKLLNFNLPSMPKFANSSRFSLPSIDSAMQWVRGEDSSLTSREKVNIIDTRIGPQPAPEAKQSVDKSCQPPTSRPPAAFEVVERPSVLRRSTSEGSFGLYRSASKASSLGDDTRWEHIHEQVSSRMKAIKDSWADSNLRLPRFKTPWSDASYSDDSPARSREKSRDGGTSREISIAIPKSRSRDPIVSPPGGMPEKAILTHPHFSKALKGLTGDVVILGGYRGSILRSAEPPHRQLWVPIKVGLNIRKVNLEVGLDYDDELKMKETIFASGMLQNIGPVDISKRLFRRLRACKNAEQGKLRVWDYGYDWRLSPRLLSRELEQFLERLPSNKHDVPGEQRGVTVIAHSLGGLITRHVVNNRPDLFSGVVYAAVPYTCVNILGPLRNGDEVLLSSKVLTAQVNFSIRTSFALLPLNGDCFIDEDTNERYPVDFFDPKTWEEYRLTPCIARPLPVLRKLEQSQSVVGSLVDSMASALPSVNPRKLSVPKKLSSLSGPQSRGRTVDNKSTQEAKLAEKHQAHQHDLSPPSDPMGTKMGKLKNPQMIDQDEETTVSTSVTIPKDAAMAYLTRTLAETKQFKLELEYRPNLENRYPPAAVIYGKSTPTVCGARVKGREGIKHADAYDNLQFASGDGVVLARAAQIPAGYRVVPGGVVSSDRGHVSLLGDLEAVGRCLNAIGTERRRRAKASVDVDEGMVKRDEY